MTTLKILILCFLTLWISLPSMGGVALSHACHALTMLVLHLQSCACCAPPMSRLFWTSNVMLVVHFQYHALVMHFQCCVCFALCNIMHVLHFQFHVCFVFAMLQLLCTFQCHVSFALSMWCSFHRV